MNKQELLENYTMEQLAEMVVKSEKPTEEIVFDIDGINKTYTVNEIVKIIKSHEEINIADFLPAEPIEAATELINAAYTRNKGELEKKIDKAFGNTSDATIEQMYSISELRQIAEHLLIYCNANVEGEG